MAHTRVYILTRSVRRLTYPLTVAKAPDQYGLWTAMTVQVDSPTGALNTHGGQHGGT